MPRVKLKRSIPTSHFGSRSTAEEVTEGVDLSGKLFVVTGCTHGIGHETMRVLSARGADVIATARSVERLNSHRNSGCGSVIPLSLELCDFESVAAACDSILAMDRPVDGLVCNAGTLSPASLELVAGVEKTFVANHLGHFVLVKRLLPALEAAASARIVITSSDSAYRVKPLGCTREELEGAGAYAPMRAYSRSKLAGALFSRVLARRLAATSVTSNALHPGFVSTNISSTATPAFRLLMKLGEKIMSKNLAQGAATTCYVASHPRLEGLRGEFFEDCNAVTITGRHHIEDDALALRIWEVCEQLAPHHA